MKSIFGNSNVKAPMWKPDLPHSLELPAKRKRNNRPYQKDQDKILVNQKHQDEIGIFFFKKHGN